MYACYDNFTNITNQNYFDLFKNVIRYGSVNVKFKINEAKKMFRAKLSQNEAHYLSNRWQ